MTDLTDLLLPKQKQIETAEYVEVISEIIEKAKPLIEVKRQQALATSDLKGEVQSFRGSLDKLTLQLEQLTNKLEKLDELKQENARLEQQLLTKLLNHPELNRSR